MMQQKLKKYNGNDELNAKKKTVDKTSTSIKGELLKQFLACGINGNGWEVSS